MDQTHKKTLIISVMNQLIVHVFTLHLWFYIRGLQFYVVGGGVGDGRKYKKYLQDKTRQKIITSQKGIKRTYGKAQKLYFWQKSTKKT